MIQSQRISRRQFLAGAGVATLLPLSFRRLAARQRKRATVRDVQAMMLQGPARIYTLVKVTSDAGVSGIAEAYGSPGVGVKEQVLALKPWLVGKDPLEIDKLYTLMGSGSPSLSGTRTDGSAHNLIRAVSGLEMALWDLAGKISRCRRRRSSADGSATGCASTITPPRATCSTRRPLPTGRRRRNRTRAGSRATSSGSDAAIRRPTRRATPPTAC
jgi:hypothetical protein